jgi:preprotein translocase subunit YajC
MLGNNELAATATKSGGFNPSELILILVVVAVFYLLLIRPQQRRKQQAQQQKNTIQPGATVRTTAGMYATVVDVDGDDVILEVAPGVEVRYMKRAVMDVITPGEAPDEVTDPVDETETDAETDTETDWESPDTTADDVDDTADEAPKSDTPVGASADAEETAYEQATGSKKD